MTTIVVHAKATKENADLLFLELVYDDRTVEMTVHPSMTLLEMAQLAVDQPFPEKPATTFDGDVQITFHTEIDPETGQSYRVVDEAIKL
jgi:hypothetical protein